jgi:hypothetical protein
VRHSFIGCSFDELYGLFFRDEGVIVEARYAQSDCLSFLDANSPYRSHTDDETMDADGYVSGMLLTRLELCRRVFSYEADFIDDRSAACLLHALDLI